MAVCWWHVDGAICEANHYQLSMSSVTDIARLLVVTITALFVDFFFKSQKWTYGRKCVQQHKLFKILTINYLHLSPIIPWIQSAWGTIKAIDNEWRWFFSPELVFHGWSSSRIEIGKLHVTRKSCTLKQNFVSAKSSTVVFFTSWLKSGFRLLILNGWIERN